MKHNVQKLKKTTHGIGKTILKTADRAGKGIADWGEKHSTSLHKIEKTASDATVSASKAVTGAREGVASILHSATGQLLVSKRVLKRLQNRIESQGGHYRELLRERKFSNIVCVGGESLATLLVASHIPASIVEAYEAAFPNMADSMSFQDAVRMLSDQGDSSLQGFLAGIKGKLFEQKYVEYLNGGNLPEGYFAGLADSPTQQGWDIQIEGPDGTVANLIQLKATDSVGYVREAIEKYPHIDVVTTEEVYSHLALSGVSENITNSGLSNASLGDVLGKGIDAADPIMDWSPPILTLAFIAFTSFTAKDLDLYQKASLLSSRTGKAYLAFLAGNALAVASGTWWLGVLGTVTCHPLLNAGEKKWLAAERLRNLEKVNQEIIDSLKSTPVEA